MAITKSFKLAELIRHIEYDSTNDIISTNKGFKDKTKRKMLQLKQQLLNLL